MKIDKSSKEAKLLQELKDARDSFDENTYRIANPDTDEPATKGELYKALYQVNLALLKIETAFDNYFCEK